MSKFVAADRIIEIQKSLGASALGPKDRSFLMREQEELWSKEFAGQPFERIVSDSWLVRVRS